MNTKQLLVSVPLLIGVVLSFAFLRSPTHDTTSAAHSKNKGEAGAVLPLNEFVRRETLVSTPRSSSASNTQDTQALMDRMRQVQRELDALKQAHANNASATVESTLTVAEQEALERERTTQTTAFLESSFLAEGRDPTWSLQAERQVSDTFNSGEIAAGSQLQQLSCQTTLCRIESHHDDPTAERVFLTRLGRLNAFGDAEAFSERIEQADGSIAAVTYVSRSGHPLPRME